MYHMERHEILLKLGLIYFDDEKIFLVMTSCFWNIQTALVAINIFGEKLDDDDEMTKSASQITFEETNERDKSLISPYDDLAFTMYVDTDVQDIIRKMDLKKQEAVLGK